MVFNIFIPFSQGLADNTVIAKVNGVLWDLDRPFEESAKLQLLKFDDDEGINWSNFFVNIINILLQLSKCFGTLLLTSWERPWRKSTEAVYAMVHRLKMDSTTTCLSKANR